MTTSFLYTLSNISEIAQKVEALIPESIKVYGFGGNLGSGKTTFIKELAKLKGLNQDISSPTFSLIKEYQNEKVKIFHLDLYRIETVQQLFEIGLPDYLESNAYCWIEWYEKAENLFFQPYVLLTFQFKDSETRELCVEIF